MDILNDKESITACNDFLIELVQLIRAELVPVGEPQLAYDSKKVKFKNNEGGESFGLTFIFSMFVLYDVDVVRAVLCRAFLKVGFFRPTRVVTEGLIVQPMQQEDLHIDDYKSFKASIGAALKNN